jgi:rod shape-determining protein MreC
MIKRSIPFLVAAIILVIVPSFLIRDVRNGVRSSLSPVSQFLNRQRVSIQDFFTNIQQVSELREERVKLQSEILSLQQEVARLENIEQENISLRRELSVSGVVKDTEKVFARIILQGSDPLDRVFIISAGTDQGVSTGQPVVHQGFLVGRILEVQKNTSVVRSIVSPKSLVQAWMPASQELGLLVGDGNTASFREIDQGKTLEPGLPVETSGLSGGVSGSLPQGIAIGNLGAILSSPSDLKQSFRVNLGVDPASIKDVLILSIPTQSK